jgi:hypothetical protein
MPSQFFTLPIRQKPNLQRPTILQPLFNPLLNAKLHITCPTHPMKMDMRRVYLSPLSKPHISLSLHSIRRFRYPPYHLPSLLVKIQQFRHFAGHEYLYIQATELAIDRNITNCSIL